jgi:hypothetical protein
MKQYIITILFLIICSISVNVSAQKLDLSGYMEYQITSMELNQKICLQDYAKLRIDFTSEIGKSVGFSGDIIHRVFHGTTEFNALDFIPERVVTEYSNTTGQTVSALSPLFDFKFSDENFLDNAYITIDLAWTTVRIGRQPLPWGEGYSWNPTDIFNSKNFLDPTYEKVGIDAFKLELPFSSEGMVTGVISIKDEWRKSIKAVKIKEHFLGYDISMMYAEKIYEEIDYLQIPFSLNSELIKVIGGGFSGELFGLGIWAEGAYNIMKTSNDYGQYLFGTDYTFENGLYVMSEYYINELGKTDKNKYTINDWMRFLSDDSENIGRNYLFFGETYPITGLWIWSNYVISNLNDGSGIFSTWFIYSLNDNTELSFVGNIPFGDKETEFGEYGGSGFVRVKVYF